MTLIVIPKFILIKNFVNQFMFKNFKNLTFSDFFINWSFINKKNLIKNALIGDPFSPHSQIVV